MGTDLKKTTSQPTNRPASSPSTQRRRHFLQNDQLLLFGPIWKKADRRRAGARHARKGLARASVSNFWLQQDTLGPLAPHLENEDENNL